MKKPSRAEPTTSPRKDADPQAQLDTDAVGLLMADHRKVEGLFEQYEAASGSEDKKQFSQQICLQLIIHAELEEAIFYPACREAGVDADVLDEAQVEHDSVKVLIGEILSGSVEDAFYAAKIAVLCEYVKHHIAEEEDASEGIIAKAQASGLDMGALGERLVTRKTELMGQAQTLLLRPPQTKSFRLNGKSDNLQENDTMARDANDRMRDDDGRFTSERGRGQSGSRYERDDDNRDRDERGRFTREDDNGRGRQASGSRYSGSSRDDDDRRGSDSSDRDRDERGRFTSDDDNGRGRQGSGSRYSGSSRDDDRRGSNSSDRDRDDQGRFMSEGRQGRGSQYDRDEDRGSSGYRTSSGGRSSQRDDSNDRDRDDRGRFVRDDDSDRGSRYGRDNGRSSNRDTDDDRRYASRNGGSRRSQDEDDGRESSGWHGDSRGHSEAARLGWEHRRASERDDSRDEARSSSRSSSGQSSRRSQEDDEDGRGWHGDSRGHAEAARLGWEHRREQDDGNIGNGGRSTQRSSSRDDDQRGGGSRGGWFGDSQGHSEAARRGSRNRD